MDYIRKLLDHADTFPAFCLTENLSEYEEGFKDMLAISEKAYNESDFANPLKSMENFSSEEGFRFGFMSYDFKNNLEVLQSENVSRYDFPEVYFFKADQLFRKESGQWMGESVVAPSTFLKNKKKDGPSIKLRPTISKAEYVKAVRSIINDILEGTVYEVNFCLEFLCENTPLDPIETYLKLSRDACMPFSALFKLGDSYIICASPERFLKFDGEQLFSQPIKGTIKRSRNLKEDEILKKSLLYSEKERAENMMIVDLVRNDLNRSCSAGSVEVPSLFHIQSFKHLHHMVSTICGRPEMGKKPAEWIQNAFPMGSMTGAPKISAMQQIEKYENFKREVFSGAIGYYLPDGKFDFNVVIRSLLYNTKSRTLSLRVGSAITYDSDPEAEYEECLLKVERIMDSLA